MKVKRRLLVTTVLAAMALAVVALPGWAAKPTPEKIFRLDVTPTTAVSGSSTVFSAKFSNKTPGNSSFNSVRLNAPTGFVITSASVSNVSADTTPSQPNAVVTTAADGTYVLVTALDPVRQDNFVTVKATTTVRTLTGCTSGSSSPWSGVAWTGSDGGGTTFRQLADSTGLNTEITVSCITTINVNAFDDANVDGDKDTGEGNLSGWSFSANNGTAQSTGADGNTSFSVPSDVAYSVCQTTQTAWTPTTPVGSASNCQTVAAAAATNGAVISLSFGNAHDTTINTHKYFDGNTNGTLDNGEGGLSGWSFTVDGNAVSGTTDANGDLSVTLAANATYQVCEVAQEGWINSDPGGTSACKTVNHADAVSNAITVNFGNWQSDGDILCGDSSPTVTGDGTDTEATLHRGPNVTGDCVLIPYDLEVINDTTVALRKDLTGQESAQFQLTIRWGVPIADYDSNDFLTAHAEFDLDGNPATLDDNFTPNTCAVAEGVVQYPALNASEPWCFAGLMTVPSGDTMYVTETYYGAGDPTIRYK